MTKKLQAKAQAKVVADAATAGKKLAREEKKEKDKKERDRVAAAKKEEKRVVAAALRVEKLNAKQAAWEEKEREEKRRQTSNKSDYEVEIANNVAENKRKLIELGLTPKVTKKAKKGAYKKQSKELEALKVDYGLRVLVPAAVFPDDMAPDGGFWEAEVVKDLNVGGKDDVALLILNEEVFARPATEVIKWETADLTP